MSSSDDDSKEQRAEEQPEVSGEVVVASSAVDDDEEEGDEQDVDDEREEEKLSSIPSWNQQQQRPRGVSIIEEESAIETTAEAAEATTQTRFRFYEPTVPLSAQSKHKNETEAETKANSSSKSKDDREASTETAGTGAKYFTFEDDDGATAGPALRGGGEEIIPSAAAQVEEEEEIPTNTNSNNTADDILRSLAETEAQRSSLLGYNTSTATATTASISSEKSSKSSRRQQQQQQTNRKRKGTKGSSSGHNSQASSYTGWGNNSQNNPYEDAIKEALNVLRRHRSGSTASSTTSTTTTTSKRNSESNKGKIPSSSMIPPPTSVGVDSTTTSKNGGAPVPFPDNTRKLLRPRTPPEADKILQYREDDDGEEEGKDQTDGGNDHCEDAPKRMDVVEESSSSPRAAAALEKYQQVKSKAKERQERMAKYASKLEEFKKKSNDDTTTTLPSFTTERGGDDDEDDSSSSLPASSSLDDQNHQTTEAASLGLKPSATADSSAGIISELSRSTSKSIEDEVHRGVERVLLAILEKAHGTSNNSETFGGGDGGILDTANSNMESILLQAMQGVSQAQSESDDSDGSATGNNLQQQPFGHSKSIELSSSQSTTAKRSVHSVVEDLLAEDMAGDISGALDTTLATPASGMALIAQQASWLGEEKKMADQELTTDEECAQGVSYGKSNDLIADEQDYEHEDGEIDGAYDDRYEDEPSALEGVLGPLNNKAGGTTGVVLDLQSHEPQNSSSSSSTSKRQASTDSRAPSEDAPSMSRSSSSRSSSSADSLSRSDIGTTEDSGGVDFEATALMKTLCAHLLPFGIASKSLEELVPPWDEENPNEAGYRIIRLSKAQLDQVEEGFEKMIESLKSKSQNDLHGSDQYDDNFVRELIEAEKVLDDEERRVNAVKRAHQIVNASQGSKPVENLKLDQEDQGDDDSVDESISEMKIHPDFPGVKSAGKGEMGDLEYFHLPIIFKSHMTGFEPTKDLVLEPGNVIAGQYLIENELGSAAFSTAYRCVDLSADGDGDEVSQRQVRSAHVTLPKDCHTYVPTFISNTLPPSRGTGT